MPTVAWNVKLNGKLIDTVFYNAGISADEVKRGLIDHDGYNAEIVVSRKSTRKRPVYTVASGREIRLNGKPLCYLARVGNDSAGYTLAPWEADELTRKIVAALNRTK